MKYSEFINNREDLFESDILKNSLFINKVIETSSFLVIGGAGTIGGAVVKEIFKRNPKIIHVVDISENNLVELVRDIRSTYGYIDGDFSTYAIDCGSIEFEALMNKGCRYDYILNLSALKHVRSEKDPYTLMRMVDVNILNTLKIIDLAKSHNLKKYFCVSTDKAANPINMMGASKRIMEIFLMISNKQIPVSMARFANVLFSNGSLLSGFLERFNKRQPISAPNDIERYFITPQESGELCLFATIFGQNSEIFFPKLSEKMHLHKFSDLAIKFLSLNGYEYIQYDTEEYARKGIDKIELERKWPCYFFQSSTTGEKSVEEFFTHEEKIDMDRFKSIGIITPNNELFEESLINLFNQSIASIKAQGEWDKQDIVEIFNKILPSFKHKELGKNLDQMM